MNNKADPINLAVLGCAAIFGPDVAEKLGPHVVIFVAASAGAGWAMLTPGTVHKLRYILGYWVLMTSTALMLTSGIAAVISSFIGHYLVEVDVNILLAPVAFAIGAVGKRWHNAGKWIIAALNRFIRPGG